jgi:small conductance mechanosensitive channel
MNKIESLLEKFNTIILLVLPNVLMAIFTLVVGIWVIRRFMKFLRAHFLKNNVDTSLSEFLISIINVVLYVLLILSCASTIGIPTTSFFAVLGAAGLAVGLALQGSLSNFAGGVLILLFKPFRIGHFITSSNNVAGTVLKIDLLYTTLRAGNGTTIYAPNGPLANAVINNVSDNATRQAEYKINVALNANIEETRKVIINVLSADPLVLKEPKPAVLVSAINDNGVVLLVRAWAENGNFWPVYHANYQKIKEAVDAGQIDLPSAVSQINLISSNTPGTHE